MMKRWAIAGILLASVIATQAADVRLGGGIHYWRTLDEIEDDSEWDDDGVAYMASLQVGWNRLLKLEGDVEIFPDGFAGSTDTTLAPQGYVVVGSAIYAALGIGTFYSSDFEDDFTEPFYILRAGLDLELLPRTYLDLHASYHFVEWEDIEDVDDNIDTDTVTLGAVIRILL